MTEIRPGIRQLKIPIPDNPLGYTNTYLLQGDGEYLLIDTGWNGEDSFDSLKKQLKAIGVELKDIAQIIVTHAHGDHYGLAGKLRQLSQAKIALHHLEKNLLELGGTDIAELTHQVEEWFRTNGVPANELPSARATAIIAKRFANPTLPDITLNGGEIISIGIFNLQVLWTPGHSPGHICLYEPDKKILFAGDHVLPVITPNISFQPQSNTNPLGDFLNSLDMVKQLDANLILPAHERIFTDLRTRVEEIIQHHGQRNSEILEAIKAGAKTAYQISNEITWMPSLGGARFQELAPWDKRMAVSETLAHLESMRIDGTVGKSHRDSIIYYQRN